MMNYKKEFVTRRGKKPQGVHFDDQFQTNNCDLEIDVKFFFLTTPYLTR